MSVEVLISQMITMIIIVCVGICCGRMHFIDEEKNAFICFLVVNITNPCSIFCSTMGTSNVAGAKELLLMTKLSILSFAGIILAAYLLSKITTRNKKLQVIYMMLYIFSNCGFMGIPLISSVFGQSYLIYVAVFAIINSILFYAMRSILLCFKSGERLSAKSFLALINPGTISCVITIVCFLAGIHLPNILNQTIQYLSNATTPLALIVIGTTIGIQKEIRQYFMNFTMLFFSFVKLLLIPFTAAFLISRFKLPLVMGQITSILIAMPSGTFPLLFAAEYHEGEKEASCSVVVTTALCVITVPLTAIFYTMLST